MEEVWKDVNDNDSYEVSSLGRVRSKYRLITCTRNGREFQRPIKGQILTADVSNSGYERIGLIYEGEGQIKRSVHRLVASAFIPNPLGKPQVNHINGIRTENHASNLEWVTSSENVQHGFRSNGRIHPQLGKTGALNKKSQAITGRNEATGEVVNFESSRCAQRTGRFHSPCIRNCLAGRAKQHGGFIWGFAKKTEEDQ